MDETDKLTEELRSGIERVQGLVEAERTRMTAHDLGFVLERSDQPDEPQMGGSGPAFR